MNMRSLFALLIGVAGALAPGLAHAASPANAAPAAPPVPGRLDPVPLAGLSVMLSPDERLAIQSVLSGGRPPVELLQPKTQGPAGSPEGQVAALPLVYLAGIFYSGPDQWTIWLNNRRIESSTPDAEFTVVEIASKAVRINWSPKDRPDSYSFVLRPRQTFDPLGREVREGDARRGLALKQEAAAK